MPTASSLDLVVVVVYLLAVTVIGCVMSRRTHDSRDFISAGGKLPGWVVGLSIVGTFVSSISFIANPGKSFAGTWSPFVFSLSLPYAALIATVYFVPWFRKSGSLSAYEHLEQRFGVWARLYAAVFNVLYHLGRIGMILYGVSLAVSTLMDVPQSVIICVLGVLVVVYTLLGGIEAVIWTDVVQSIILLGGMIVCVAVLVTEIPGGPAEIIDVAVSSQENKFSLGSMELDLSAETFWTILVFGFFINLQNFAADQTYVQRYFTARNEAEARRSVWLGALAYIPISAVLFFLGTALFVYYQSQAATLPEDVTADRVLPYFMISELPSGVAGLLIAAVLAAAMSTVDSSLNSSASLLLCDVRNRFFHQPQVALDGTVIDDSKGDLVFLRAVTVLLGILGIAVAFLLIDSKGMLDIWWKISGVLSGGTLGLILLARFTNSRGTAWPLIGVVLGVLSIAAITLASVTFAEGDNPPQWFATIVSILRPVRGWLHPWMSIVAGTTIVFVIGAIGSRRPNKRG